MYDKTISDLKNLGLIEQDDIAVACMDNITKSIALFGAIGGAIAQSKASRYIVVANKDSLRIFDVEKKTGNYLGTCSTFRADEIAEAFVKGSLGTFNVVLKTTSGNYKYQTSNKFDKFLQKEEIGKLKAFFESSFGKK